MTMQGSLQDYGLAQALQHIAQQGQDGVLQVIHRGSEVNFSFVAGCLVRTRMVGRDADKDLCAQLVLAEVSGAQAGAGLCEVDPKIVATFEALRSSDAVFHALLYTDGAYLFTDAAAPPSGSHAPISAASLLSLGLDQLGRWPQIRRRIPSSTLVFAPQGSLDAVLAGQGSLSNPMLKSESAEYAAGFGLGSQEAVAWGQTDEGPVGHAERLIYSLVDGHRDVQVLVALSHLGEFATLAALAALADLGLVGVVAGGGFGRQPAAGQAMFGSNNALRLAFGSAGKVLLFAAQLAILAMMALSGQLWSPHAPRKAGMAFDAQAAQSMMWEALAPAVLQRQQQAEVMACPAQPLWQPWHQHAARWPDPQQVTLVRPLR